MHELLDDRLAPRAERAPAEAAAEPLDAGDADAVHLARVAVEDQRPRVDENLPDLVLLARLDVVIAEHRGDRDAKRQLAREHARFLGQPVVGQIAGEQQHLGRFGDAREQGLKRALRGLGAVQIAKRGDAHDSLHSWRCVLQELSQQNGRATGGLHRLDEDWQPCKSAPLPIHRSHRRPTCRESGSAGRQYCLQLGRLIVAPMASVGILAGCLMWEMEHVGSIVLALALVASGVGVAVLVARGARRRIAVLSDYYEALLRTADEQSRRAEAANRLKDDFLATLSHELRTPLNSILGWSRLLASGKLDSEGVLKAVQAIERSGWAQARVVDDLLDMSHIVGGKLQLSTRPMLVAPIITDAVQSLQHAAESKHIVVETSIDSPLGPLVGDPERLQQIVWNLLSNAIKFTPPGGAVKVEATRAGNDFHLSVGDTGIGFEDGVAAHLFERFRQGDSSSTRQFGGLGLGLGIVRYLTELHGGTVDAESPGENRGAIFHVRLPMHVASATAGGVPPVMETRPFTDSRFSSWTAIGGWPMMRAHTRAIRGDGFGRLVST